MVTRRHRATRGSVAIDTVPLPERPPFPLGLEGDPVPPIYLLDKAKVAQLQIHQLDTAIAELERQIEFVKLERDMLKQEYKLK